MQTPYKTVLTWKEIYNLMFWALTFFKINVLFSIDNSIIARLQKNEPMNFPNFPDYLHHFPQLFGDLPQQFERRFF